MGVTALLAGAGVAALIVSGCSTSSTTVEKTTVTETVTNSTAPSTPAAAAAGGLPQPPTGASPIRSSEDAGMVHARYSVDGLTPKQVADYYVGIW
ncbi:MAG TPA: hypothetical protein PK871_07235, partial [Mycobacterium sp.]|nr:hypothetical protein [Mycobacterium sp.]